MSAVLGIDPGKDGAIVVLDGSVVLHAERTCRVIGAAKWHAAHAALADHLRSVVVAHRPQLAVLELYAGRPGQAGALTIGVGWGLWLGLLSAMGVPVRTPTSAAWTRDLFRGVAGEGKERAISWARQTCPGLDLTPGAMRKPHDGLADAACLALWGQR